MALRLGSLQTILTEHFIYLKYYLGRKVQNQLECSYGYEILKQHPRLQMTFTAISGVSLTTHPLRF